MRTTIRVGSVEVTAIRDKVHDFDRSWHYPSVPDEAWEPYRDLLESDPACALANFHCFVIKGDGRVVMIDTGWGPKLGPPGVPESRGELPTRLAEIGVDPGDVDAVAFTHLHADHVGWNLIYRDGAKPRPRFASARYLVSEKDWGFFTSREGNHPNIVEHALPLESLGVLDTFSDGERLFILGDVIHHPVVATETGWVHRFDNDPAQAVATRRRQLSRLEEAGTLVAACHLGHPSFGRFVREDGRRVWNPASLGGPGA